ncbi:hypothetical protein M9R32_13135 [Paenisporosarcina quisquiliarum]|uniref:Uncharacterized protein n=1 Tax=Paenisporosarcina quisquiliarum TaxID=365346 RepID=A0A9X3LKC3_9BACL|nr:hypothetical protein [Paenisporosarcina quisquiliarum]MCZ8538134.1 hypothetical protein [Paenisporosarcina quisquiliarum]
MKERDISILIITTITVLSLFVYNSPTDTGIAIKKEMKDIFSPEKVVKQSIEGMDEEIQMKLNEGHRSEYVMYVDEERYMLTHGEKSDVITPLHPAPENYPEVTMEIEQFPNEKPLDLVEIIEAQLHKEFTKLEVAEITNPIKGYQIHGAAGNKADSKIVNAYVISNGKEGSFVITQFYFLEAAEGHGARLHHMLETFKIVE